VVYPEETIFFRRFLPRAKGLAKEDQLDLSEECLIHIFTWSREAQNPSQAGFPDRDYSAISYQAINTRMRELVRRNYRNEGDILSAAILAFGHVTSKINDSTRYWVEKSPYNEYFAERIFDWWPEARCVHIVRDPRDNFSSYKLKHPDWEAEFFSANWNRSTGAGIRNRELYGNHRYFMLRYEDLVQSPEESLRQLTEFLGIQWSDSLSNPTKAGVQWKGNSMFSDRFQGISTAPVSRWKERISTSDAATIELMTRNYLDIFQYSQQTLQSMTFPKVFAVRWRVGAWSLRRLFHRLNWGIGKFIEKNEQDNENTEGETPND
jgi:hypothetical protein